MTSPFHAGEQAVQERLGVREEIEPWARRVVRPVLPEQHQQFYAGLPFLVAAARDAQGRPWATLLAGEPGFAHAPDERSLAISVRPGPGDALEGALGAGADLGLLGIDLATRRRNRVNGRIASTSGDTLVLGVEQAFGNCPQYIWERQWSLAPEAPAGQQQRSDRLSPAMVARIEAADTFFIASGHRASGESETFGMDASHRGGEPGFVRVENEREIVFPDYAGNNHFNTIGNLLLDPRAGFLFVDFETGDLLQLTGSVEIDWDSPAVAEFPGARRLVRFALEEAVELPGALPLRWTRDGGAVRSLRVVGKTPESDDVTSFVFASRDGGELPDFEPGQHLPIELEVPGHDGLVRRTYSLSSAPSDGMYRISVKRESHGVASGHLHEQVEEGAILNAKAPAGEFVLRPGARPVVLLSAGVGLTPMVSMLREMLAQGDARHVYFLHGARDGRHHALRSEVQQLVSGRAEAHAVVAYSRPAAGDRQGRDYDVKGRVDGELVSSRLPDLDADFYLCGPTAFMAALQEDLEQRGVPAERMHYESFGPRA